MIARDKFEEVVYSLLFPGGQLPLDLKQNLGAIDARIAEIHSLAQGKALGYILSSDAIRCGYQDAKALQEKSNACITPDSSAPIAEEKPEPAEIPTIRNSLIVEEIKKVKPETVNVHESSPDTKEIQNSSIIIDLTKTGKYGRYEVPISAEVDEEIHRLASDGMPTAGISNELAKKGIMISWQRVRSVLATTARLKAKANREEAHKTEEAALRSAAKEDDFGPLSDQVRETSPSQSHPGVEGAPVTVAREASRPTRGTPEESSEAKPEPKRISRADLNIRIWDAWKAGDDPAKISEDLNEEGYYYDERQVVNRLKQQGAKL